MNNTEDLDYKKYLQLISKRKYLFVILALVIMTGVVITSYLLPKRYEAKSTVFIEKSVISDLVKGIAITPSFEDKLRVLAYAMKSRALLVKVFNDLDLNINRQNTGQMEKMIRAFQENTDIKLKDNEGLFTITFTSEDPRLARDYVNALVRRYIEENITSKREESYSATNFIAEQITAIKAKLEESEAKANSYKRDNGSVLAQNEGSLLAEIGFAQQKLDEIALKRRQLESMQSLAKKNDPLKVKLAVLEKKRQELSLVYTDNHPEIIELNNSISDIKQQLKSGTSRANPGDSLTPEMVNISMELNSLRDNENIQRRFIESKQSVLRSIPAVRTGLDELEREKISQKNLYEQLMARYGQSEMAKQVEVQDKATTFRVVDPAVIPSQPYSPQRVKIILLGIVGALVASFAFLVLLDHLDQSVRNIETLKSLGIQILAVVPTIENPVELEAVRKRDCWFYGIAGTCFILILATVPLELMRSLSIDVFSYAGIKSHLMNLTLK
ncbi:MAG: GNVR domain-containing protein [Desulfuromonadaceae bacterium]|nr:GNVR domain-containing protein [Desulfuromonadaceae bacterium]